MLGAEPRFIPTVPFSIWLEAIATDGQGDSDQKSRKESAVGPQPRLVVVPPSAVSDPSSLVAARPTSTAADVAQSPALTSP